MLFLEPDSGIAAGGYNVNSYATGNSVVILTTNGGDSWERVYKSSRTHEWCWKISFNPEISRTFGVVSIQRMNGLQSYYLKTTNKGFNWSEIPFMSYNEQGIGFLNENTGWIGGYGNSTVGDSSYQTTDGGISWVTVGWSRYLNRIRFINDTLAFASGHKISKYSRDIVSVEPAASVIPDKFNLYQNFPNPFNPKTIIKLDIPSSGQYGLSVGGNNNLIHVSLIVYDQIGKEITVLIDEDLNPGSYKASFDGGYYPSGIYYYKLDVGSGINKYSQTKKMLMLK
ncbi:MAG: hypothetical protein IPL53_23275 [Ignavibacteria bacterium]|nr:hypothetical protein [Ignavibacteria bacterium]